MSSPKYLEKMVRLEIERWALVKTDLENGEIVEESRVGKERKVVLYQFEDDC